MGFRLVPKSVTLNDPERPNRPNGCVISPNSVPFFVDYVKVVEDTRILSAAEMLVQNVVSNDVSFMAILLSRYDTCQEYERRTELRVIACSWRPFCLRRRLAPTALCFRLVCPSVRPCV